MEHGFLLDGSRMIKWLQWLQHCNWFQFCELGVLIIGLENGCLEHHR